MLYMLVTLCLHNLSMVWYKCLKSKTTSFQEDYTKH